MDGQLQGQSSCACTTAGLPGPSLCCILVQSWVQQVLCILCSFSCLSGCSQHYKPLRLHCHAQ